MRPTIEEEIRALPREEAAALAHELREFTVQHLPVRAGGVLERVARIARETAKATPARPVRCRP